MGITIKAKMEMSRANTLTAAFVTWMQNELCRVSRLGWGGDGQGDAAEPTASPVLMGSRPFYAAVARDGEPRHSLPSAGKEALPQELIKKSMGRAACSRAANSRKNKPGRSGRRVTAQGSGLRCILGWIVEGCKSGCHLGRFAENQIRGRAGLCHSGR